MSGFWSSSDFMKSNTRLTETVSANTFTSKCKELLKKLKYIYAETTVEPCLFIYMMCTALSSFAVQNMHLEKSCRVNLKFGDEICDRIKNRNTTGLEEEMNQVQSLVAKVMAWKFPLQNGIPAVLVLFVGAWSDKNKRRKILILVPMVGEIVTNAGLLLATYYFDELSLPATALIEALPPAFTGSYIIIFIGMYSFMADRTTIENRTVRYGIAAVFVSLGSPTGTALSGVALRAIGYYGMFTLLLCLHMMSFFYGIFKLHDVVNVNESIKESGETICGAVRSMFGLVWNTFVVVLRKRQYGGRTQIFLIMFLYLLMVGPLYGDSQVAYLYAIKKFGFTEVEYSLYGTIIICLGLCGTIFCIGVLSKRLSVRDCNIGVVAGLSRIAGCFMFAFAPTRRWFYSAPFFNMFSSCSLPILRSMLSKVVTTEDIAKLNALVGVMEAIAPAIYMPTSSYIYIKTIENFPGAFYMFDAALTLVALVLFLIFYIQVRRWSLIQVEHPSKSNEVSRF